MTDPPVYPAAPPGLEPVRTIIVRALADAQEAGARLEALNPGAPGTAAAAEYEAASKKAKKASDRVNMLPIVIGRWFSGKCDEAAALNTTPPDRDEINEHAESIMAEAERSGVYKYIAVSGPRPPFRLQTPLEFREAAIRGGAKDAPGGGADAGEVEGKQEMTGFDSADAGHTYETMDERQRAVADAIAERKYDAAWRAAGGADEIPEGLAGALEEAALAKRSGGGDEWDSKGGIPTLETLAEWTHIRNDVIMKRRAALRRPAREVSQSTGWSIMDHVTTEYDAQTMKDKIVPDITKHAEEMIRVWRLVKTEGDPYLSFRPDGYCAYMEERDRQERFVQNLVIRTICNKDGGQLGEGRIRQIVKGVIARVKYVHELQEGGWDSNEYLYAFENGLFDARTGGPAGPEYDGYMARKVVPHDLILDAKPTTGWADAYGELFNSRTKGLRTALWLHAKALMAKKHGDARAYLLHGPGGNGKSILIEHANELLGDGLASSPGTADLNDREVRYKVAHSRAALTGETDNESGIGVDLFSPTFDSITGGDRMEVRRNHGHIIRVKVECTWISSLNRLPDPGSRKYDESAARRIRVIPVDGIIDTDSDPRRIDYLVTDGAENAHWVRMAWLTMCWLLRPENRKLEIDGAVPLERAAAGDEERARGADQFVGELASHPREGWRISESELYEVYRKYCEGVDIIPMGSGLFRGRLNASGFDLRRARTKDTSGNEVFWQVYMATLPAAFEDYLPERLKRYGPGIGSADYDHDTAHAARLEAEQQRAGAPEPSPEPSKTTAALDMVLTGCYNDAARMCGANDMEAPAVAERLRAVRDDGAAAAELPGGLPKNTEDALIYLMGEIRKARPHRPR